MNNIKINFEVFITEKNGIHAHIEGELLGEDEFFFYLLSNGQVISRIGWQSAPFFSWTGLGFGQYRVRGFVQRGSNKEAKFSHTVTIQDSNLDGDWREYSVLKNEIPPLPYAPLSDPHQDIVIILGDSPASLNLPGFASFSYPSGDKYIEIFSKLNHKNIGGIIFSGSAFFKDDLIFGQEDAASVVNQEELVDSTGDFVAVQPVANGLIFTNDFFGVQKIYYYQDGQIFLASNRVHLLLLTMAVAEVKMHMDIRQVKSTLVSGYVQPFQQIFSENLMVSGVKLLPIDARIVISNGVVAFEPKPIADLLADQTAPVRCNEYSRLLESGVQDVLRQARAVLNHPRFMNVVIDATGGMDSRVILAAVAKLQEQHQKLSINAMDTTIIPLDIRVACTLTDILGIAYDSISEIVEIGSDSQRKLGALSQLLGTYFGYDISKRPNESIRCQDAINITGFFGEICLRPYYSRSYLRGLIGNHNCHEQFYSLLNQENLSSLSNVDAMRAFHDVYADVIESLPGARRIEKYDLHYLYFRNGLHCSDIFRFKYDTPRVGVIQSANLFRLKRKLYGRSPETVLQNDVIAQMAPVLLTVPYASARDNDALNDALPLLQQYKNNTVAGSAILAKNGDKAVLARQKKKLTRVFMAGYQDDNINLNLIAERATVEISERGELIDDLFGKEIISAIRYGAFSHVLVNKVTMAYFMWQLTNMSPEEARRNLACA